MLADMRLIPYLFECVFLAERARILLGMLSQQSGKIGRRLIVRCQSNPPAGINAGLSCLDPSSARAKDVRAITVATISMVTIDGKRNMFIPDTFSCRTVTLVIPSACRRLGRRTFLIRVSCRGVFLRSPSRVRFPNRVALRE